MKGRQIYEIQICNMAGGVVLGLQIAFKTAFQTAF